MSGSREITRMRAELDHAVRGNPWHGSPLAKLLEGVTPAEAHAHPVAGAHSIWELVRHVSAWTQEASQRLRGGVPALPAIGNFPPAPATPDAAGWAAALDELTASHEDFLAALDALDPAALEATPIPTRDPAHGIGVKHRVLVHGLAQHHAYHGGQIALLRKARAAGTASRR
ncbi:MAG: DinB family protein [Gemmatimonadetes bacterium]|nr:DinB family protein [Gemmatimonadota bacterium]